MRKNCDSIVKEAQAMLDDKYVAEDLLLGLEFNDFSVKDNNSKVRGICDIFDEYGYEYILMIAVTPNVCSSCRDDCIKYWNTVYLQQENLPIFLLNIDDTKNAFMKTKAELNLINSSLKFGVDENGGFFSNFGSLPEKKPYCMIIRQDKVIVEILELNYFNIRRLERMKKLFLLLNNM